MQELLDQSCEMAGDFSLYAPCLWVEVNRRSSVRAGGLSAREASIGCQESLRAQGPESSLELVLLLGCLGLRLRGESWVRPEQKMAWKACWAGLQGDGIWDASVWQWDAWDGCPRPTAQGQEFEK